MVREAQALARLAHPNVVAVFDVDETDYGLCIALEYVEGQDFGSWLDTPRPWAEAMEVISEAARGLAAAHAAGLVHRDVKPGNILVGDDGRICVSDFGLARGSEGPSHPSANTDEGTSGSDLALTEAGTVMGTPAYMAPEQHAGADTDARADLYALCISAWEACYGQRPFTGDTIARLFQAKLDGAPAPPPGDVPRWLYDVLARGLAPDRDDRWPTVEAFLTAVEGGRARRRRRRIWLSLGALGACAAAIAGGRALRDEQIRRNCIERGQVVESVWDDGRRAEVVAALRGASAEVGPEIASKVTPWIDAQVTDLAAAEQQSCLASELDHSVDVQASARVRWCLDERRLELEALVDRLGTDPEASLGKAVQLASRLDPVQPCTDPASLSRIPLPSPQQREAADAIRARVAKAVALQGVGSFDEGLKEAQAALTEAEALGWDPLTVRARLRVGSLLRATGKPKEAEPVLEEAYFAAAELGLTDVEAEVAHALVFTVGVTLDRYPEGLRWDRHHKVALSELPDPAGLREAGRLSYEAHIRQAMGQYEEAEKLHREVLRLRKAALGPEHPDVGAALNDLGNVRSRVGDFEGSLQLLQEALAIRERQLGENHPLVATTLSALGATRRALGDNEGAKQAQLRALAIREKVYGPDHPNIAYSLGNLAAVHWALAEFDEAQAAYERALEILVAALGPDHPDVAVSEGGLAAVLQVQGRLDEARVHHLRALAIEEKAYGPDHPEVAGTVNNLGHIELESGRYDEALAYYERALAIREKTLGTDHPALAYTLVGMAELRVRKGEGDEALPLAQRALALRQKAHSPPAELAQSKVLIAKAMWSTPARRDEALQLAREAEKAFEQDEANPGDLADVRDWLASRSK
jgi:tetratricopeptide (TPR) repeat protein